jgi:two-component system, NtrC family, sensor kinase
MIHGELTGDFIIKPFNPEILLSKVRVFLELDERKAELLRNRAGLETMVSRLEEEIEARERTEKALQKAHDDLERRVEERTGELMTANRQLRHEIQERERAEGDLKTYAARLELVNQELQEFAFIASHDLKEPLRKIQAFTDRMRIQCSASLDDAARDYLGRMEGAANRMRALLEALLGYSQMATRSACFELTDLAILTGEVVADVEVLIESKGGSVVVGDLPTVEADPTQMRQLLQNLITNALKFNSSEKPLVKVYGEACSDRTCRIFIEDNGIGFDETFLDRIFKPFQRLHGRSSSYEGTGMGLAICRKIVERHSGSITARSTPGKGTTFIVTLPEKQPC